jgi:ATP-dependent Clp endopeptidase proteolytic subunit ClpP
MQIGINLDNAEDLKIPDSICKIEPIVVQDFTDSGAQQFARGINYWRNTPSKIIPVVINSYGGSVYGLMSMIDTMQNCDKIIATIVEGKAMSCGFLLFCLGTEGYRFMSKNATIMCHDISMGTSGKLQDIEIDVEQCKKLSKMAFQCVSKHIGKEGNYIEKLLSAKKNKDWYMSYNEAKKHNFANSCRIPKMDINVSVEYKFIT